MTDELLDLVDADDRVIGTVGRAQFDPRAGYIRVADCLTVRSDGKLWIPRRTASKKLAPSALDFSVGEHVQAGESYQAAMLRGFEEEQLFKPELARLAHCFTAAPSPGLPVFQAVYLYRDDRTPVLNPADFSEAHWLDPEEVIARVAAGDPAKPNLVPTIRRLAPWLRPAS
ncbi:MAG TPA: NUDIX domain-containing protein [Kofleriaceae bacterium]